MPTIDLQSGRLSYATTGQGDSVIALHSSGCSGAQWRSLAAAIGAQYRLFTPDLMGYGSSDPWQGSADLTLEDEASRIEAVMAACPGPIHLVGHSFGGAVALRLARSHSERLASLTLIEPVAFQLLRGDNPDSARGFGEIQRLAQSVGLALAEDDRDGAMRTFVDYWNGPDAWAAMGERQREALLRVADKVPQDFQATMTEQAGLAEHAAIDVPTLLIGGGRSPEPVRRIFELLAATIPASHGLVLRNAGHMLPLTHGKAVNRAIALHIADNTRHDLWLPLAA